MPSGRSLIRLSPLPFSSLPPHPALEPAEPQSADPDSSSSSSSRPQVQRPSLHTFLHSALTEATALLSTTANPDTFKPYKKKKNKPRPSPPSTAKVHLFTARLAPSSSSSSSDKQPNGERSKGKGKKGEDELWICRHSTHIDASDEPGTASWEEFEAGLRGAGRHSENEMAYTPSVSRVERLLEWEGITRLEIDIAGNGDGGGTTGGGGGDGAKWTGIEMCVNIITHTFRPSILIAPRTFIVLIISAGLPPSPSSASTFTTPTTSSSSSSSTTSTKGFLTIQIPLSYSHTDPTIPPPLREKIASSAPSKNAIFASYASVERVVWLPPPPQPDEQHAGNNNGKKDKEKEKEKEGKGKAKDLSARGRIEWTMATTSDAGGSVPRWVQRSWTLGGVPRAVVADVRLFLGWVARRRKPS